MNLEIYNYFPDTTPHAKFQGLCRRGWSGQIASLTHERFCPFLVTSAQPQVASLDKPSRAIRHYTSFWLLRLERWTLKFDPFTSKKLFKIGTLSWRSMEHCSRPNSGTVSYIQFKLGTGIENPSSITWHDSKVKRSKVKVTTSRNVSS